MSKLRFERITHPTELTRESESAFYHALRLAVAVQGKLDILHVHRYPQIVIWDGFPHARETLARWQLLPSGNGEQRLRVEKISEYGKDPVDPILNHLKEYPADLIVLGTHRRDGLDRWLHKEIAHKIARDSSTSTLFVPYGVDGFVSPSTGSLSLRRLLLPVDWQPSPQIAVDAVVQVVSPLACEELELTLLHVAGTEEDMPMLDLPEREGWRWYQRHMKGDVVDSILAAGQDLDADLIVMATQGRDGFLDMLRGSNTERVLQHARCPVLSVPVSPY